MLKKRFSKQLESLIVMLSSVKTKPSVTLTTIEAEALARAILADDVLVPREMIIAWAKRYEQLVEQKIIKKDDILKEIIKYTRR
jgi:hypothetical protein